MPRSVQMDARRILDRLEDRYGSDPDLRQRMLPVVVRILETDAASRKSLLGLVVQAYERLNSHLGSQEPARIFSKWLNISPPQPGHADAL